MNPRYRFLLYGVAALLAVWLGAFALHRWADSRKVTLEKVRAYAASVNFGQLSGAERETAIRRLADLLNRLNFADRREARLGRLWEQWFAQMTEEERALFVELTLPTGFKQMIGAFENFPPERRQRAINDALRGLREAQAQMARGGLAPPGNGPALTEDLQKRIATIGLKTFYAESSAQTKAELAPLLEEMQRMMESGRFLPSGRRGPP